MACLAAPGFGLAQIPHASSAKDFTVVLTPPTEKYIEVTACSSAGPSGRWNCIIKNKTNYVFDMKNLFVSCYDKNGVKDSSESMYDTIDANGASRSGVCGFYKNVSKAVMTLK